VSTLCPGSTSLKILLFQVNRLGLWSQRMTWS
jgi:hypothetical protein